MDEETRRKEELRARMARLGGGGLPGMGGQFNPFGAPPPAPPRKKASKDRKASEDAPTSPQARGAPMVPVPGMGGQRMQSPGSDTTERVQRDAEETPQEEKDEPEMMPPPKRVSTMDRAAPPPVPKGKLLQDDALVRRKTVCAHRHTTPLSKLRASASTRVAGLARAAFTWNPCSRLRDRTADQTLQPTSYSICSHAKIGADSRPVPPPPSQDRPVPPAPSGGVTPRPPPSESRPVPPPPPAGKLTVLYSRP